MPAQLAYIRKHNREVRVVELSENQKFHFSSSGEPTIADSIRIAGDESLVIGDVLKISRRGGSDRHIGRLELDVLLRVAEKNRGKVLPLADWVKIDFGSPAVLSEQSLPKSFFRVIQWAYFCLRAAGVILACGACHAAAWNSHFPSNLECWL